MHLLTRTESHWKKKQKKTIETALFNWASMDGNFLHATLVAFLITVNFICSLWFLGILSSRFLLQSHFLHNQQTLGSLLWLFDCPDSAVSSWSSLSSFPGEGAIFPAFEDALLRAAMYTKKCVLFLLFCY